VREVMVASHFWYATDWPLKTTQRQHFCWMAAFLLASKQAQASPLLSAAFSSDQSRVLTASKPSPKLGLPAADGAPALAPARSGTCMGHCQEGSAWEIRQPSQPDSLAGRACCNMQSRKQQRQPTSR